jgi:hypothetical protein
MSSYDTHLSDQGIEECHDILIYAIKKAVTGTNYNKLMAE